MNDQQTAYTGLEIAVIGMSCQFPGSENLSAFWENLKAGNEGILHLTKEELIAQGVKEEFIKDPSFVGASGFLKNKEYFDNHFFHFTPHESKVLDPQMRVFFQTAWNALEDAAINPETFPGRIGIYAGARDNPMWQAYTSVTNDPSKVDGFTLGQYNNKEFIATLLSYKLNLKGPAVFVATACSTSLVALHQAGRALLLGDADVCLAGGVSVSTTLTPGYFHREGMIMSSDGKCRAFAEGSDGTVGGEGSGVVVLKRLKDALRDGDHIYALIKGSAINNDGKRKVGYSAPSIDGQVDCIRRAHAMSKIESHSISYVEAHGTGTKLGDPIEVQALNEVFGSHNGLACKLGSVKSNIGHTGTAAGIAGFIKTVLALKNEAIPPSLHASTSNPEVPFSEGPMQVNTALNDWKQEQGSKRRAGVSSFGIGGTNAHVVLEEAPVVERQPEQQLSLVPVSGMNLTAALANRQALIDWIDRNPEASLSDVAHTLQKGRKHFEYRLTVAADSLASAREQLSSRKPSASKAGQAIVFMCSGQGSQYTGMTAGLYTENQLFREWIDKGLATASQLSDQPFEALLFGTAADNEQINELENSLPLMYIVEHAMAQLLMNQGIKPSRLIGHSSGEYVAACIGGVFSFETGLKLVIQRSQLMQSASEGRMLSVPMSEQELTPLLGENISLTAVNAPDACVVGGSQKDIEAFSYKLNALGYDCKELKATRAAHSHFMDPVLPAFKEILEQVELKRPLIPIISNVTGKELTAEEATSPEYWCRHLRHAVRFSEGAEQLLKTENTIFIEIGPGQTLCNFVRQQDPQRTVVQTIRHPKNPVQDNLYFHEVLGVLWENGLPIDFNQFSGEGRKKLSLPGYQFDRIKYSVVADMEVIQQAIGVQLSAEPEAEGQLGFYAESWQQSLPQFNAGKKANEWMVCIADKNDFTRSLVQKLQADCPRVTVAWRGDFTEAIQPNEYMLDVANDSCYADFLQLLENPEGKGEIIYFAPGLGNLENQTLSNDESAGFFDLTQCVKTMEELHLAEQLDFTIVTQDAQSVSGNEAIRASNGMLFGIYKVLSQECGQLNMRYIDIDAKLVESALAETVATELTASDTEREIALRWNKRWIRSLDRLATHPLESQTQFRKGSTAIITGAPGGMASVIAQHLGTAYNMNVGLIGRSPISPELQAALEQSEISYTYCIADMGNQQQVEAAVAAITSTFETPLEIVVHAAGIGDYAGLLLGRKKQDSAEVLSPKVDGTHYLLQAVQPHAPNFMVMCSSRATEIAPVGQVAYIAGNEYQNAVAKGRMKTVSIGWEAWKEVGMAIKSKELAGKDDEHLSTALTNEEAIQAMHMALQLNLPHVVVSRQNLHQIIAEYRSRIAATVDENNVPAIIGVQSRAHLKSDFIAPANAVEIRLQELWSEFFGMENIGVEDDFFELGGDSLKLMRMHRVICASFAIKFELVELFIHFKIRPLANFLTQSGLVAQEVETAKAIETIKF